MKKICLVFSVLVTVLMLFSATKVGAQCTPDPLMYQPPGWCFEGNDIEGIADWYSVQIANPDGTPIQSGGTFPVIVGGKSVFTYKITKIPKSGAKVVGHIDILIPSCFKALAVAGVICNPPCSSTTPFNLYQPGAGDPSIGFGLGLKSDYTFKWNWPWASSMTTGYVSFTLEGKVYASPNPALVKAGSSSPYFPYGQILAPSCGQVPAQVFPPQVPHATMKQEQISGVEDSVEVCIESTDQSGFPTSVYSCNVLGTPACDCLELDRDYWVKKSLSELNIVASTLQQVWIDPDPRSPATYIIRSGSTCVTKCYPSGYCYVGPRGCTP